MFIGPVFWHELHHQRGPILAGPVPPGDDEMAVYDVTPPSRGAGIQPAQPAQVSCLLTCDDLLPVYSYL